MRSFTVNLAALLLAVSTVPSIAAEKKSIDKKVRSESTEYAVSLAAQDGDLGHAFVIWNKGDSAANMTVQQVVGFYPQADKTKYEAVFGLSPGQIFDDSREKPDYVVIVSVNSDAYEKARTVFERWKSSGNYMLGFSDCTTFATEIGAAIGLNMPSRVFAPHPIEYIKKVGQSN
ncbi:MULTISPECIES: hypothetical protein [unclassified Mesorhizobium]|uniref:hypothetical protein n=1 Tax=unclassified Mesorhizobium TaxID=325217 RepID=UPI000FD338B8|nr:MULTISPECIES: hypothetical protein [unclassified Mesorhizobium]RUW18622.1 hypothetical protein EOA34_31595 [Mesorhizobium sp. M4B.F.Ca.ET.013.02.1.1]TGV22695.1 hypothetical protein EN786_28205 [Mesorhizobium sp. M4B.F.Ca.ET.143.01.1.1]